MVVDKTTMRERGVQRDERLSVQAAQKDPARFADLYEQNFERVYAFVVGRVHNRELAEDLTSETFHKALAGLAKFDWRGIPFSAWLIRIASNLVADQWRKSSREERGDSPEPASSFDIEDLEHRARLFRKVEQLPEGQRRVLQLRFAEGKSLAEIAHEMGRSEGAVKQLQFRGMEKLRSLVKGRGVKHG